MEESIVAWMVIELAKVRGEGQGSIWTHYTTYHIYGQPKSITVLTADCPRFLLRYIITIIIKPRHFFFSGFDL